MPEQEAIAAESSPAVAEPDPLEGKSLAERQDHYFKQEKGAKPAPAEKKSEPGLAAAPAEGASGSESEPGALTADEKERRERSERDRAGNERRERGRRALQREIDELRGQVQALAGQGGKAPSPDSAPGSHKPKLSEFVARYQTYEEAVEAYADARDLFNRSQESEQAAQAARSQRDTEWEAAMDGLEAEHGDFQEVMDRPFVNSHVMMEALKDRGKDGAIMLLHLARNPAEAKRIAALTVNARIPLLADSDPAQAAYLYGKLESAAEREFDKLWESVKPKEAGGAAATQATGGKSSPNLQPKPKTQTTAPAPPKSVSGRASAGGDPAEEAARAGDWERYLDIMDERKQARRK